MCVTRRSEEAGSNVKTERGEGVEDCKKKRRERMVRKMVMEAEWWSR